MNDFKGDLLGGVAPKQEIDIDKPDTCGSCRFCTHNPDLQSGVCGGSPPVPVIMGIGRDLAGREGVNIQSLRPMVQLREPGCALYKARPSSIIGAH